MFDAFVVKSLTTVILLSGIPLAISAVVGVIVAVIQSVTQVQEQTVVFVAKLAVVVTVMYVGTPWALRLLISLTQEFLESMRFLGGLA